MSKKNSRKNIVYIATNESMPGMIKIGVTDNLAQRLRDLDTTGVPLPFECYYAVEVNDAKDIETKLHGGLVKSRVRQRREFFNVSPEEAKQLLSISGGKDVTPSVTETDSEDDNQALKTAHKRRENFRFDMVGIVMGTKLQFKNDPEIECEVFNSNKVQYKGEPMSISKSAALVLDTDAPVQGTLFWYYQGESLDSIRIRTYD